MAAIGIEAFGMNCLNSELAEVTGTASDLGTKLLIFDGSNDIPGSLAATCLMYEF